MNKLNFLNKNTGDTLEAQEWNAVVGKIDELVDASNNSGEGGSVTPIDTQGILSVSSKGNVTLGSTKNVNIEPAYVENGGEGTYGDVLIKPGDDITLESHHRILAKRDEITVKTSNGEEGPNKAPVKLLVIASDVTLSSKGKKEDSNVMNINVTTGNGKGYLKVRAQAIDLRCEEHGGIALQPKGKDSSNHMNKIKFEHGGGDGLEFGTFNTEKTSIFTDEYRFKKNGVWKMATRQTEASDKADENDDTTALKYVKQTDDFYDIISSNDAQTTTEAIIKSAAALNNELIETSLSSKGNLKISSFNNYKIVAYTGTPSGNELTFTVDKTGIFTKDELKLILSGSTKLSEYIDTKQPFLIDGDNGIYRLSENITPKIGIESEEEVDIDAKYGDVVITSGDSIKMEAPEIRLNAINDDKSGGTVNFGATLDVLFINSKLTKGLNIEASNNPTRVKLVIQNNTADTVYWDETNSIFRVPMKKIYTNAEHTIEITPDNYNDYKELPAYFADGTMLPEDYSCFIGVTTEETGTYITNVYKLSTKGSSAVLSKNIKGPVGQYTSSVQGTLGNRVPLNTPDDLTTLEFEFPEYTGGTNISLVLPEQFVVIKEVELFDILDIISDLKTMKTNNEGPWASNL